MKTNNHTSFATVKMLRLFFTILSATLLLLTLNYEANAQTPLSATVDPVCTSKCCTYSQPCSCSAGVIVTGGLPPYQYLVFPNPGSVPVGFSACVTGLCPGTYDFHIRDANNTNIVYSVTIGGPCCKLNCRDTSFCFNVPDTAIHLVKPTYTGSDVVGGSLPCAFDSIWSNAPGVYPVGTTVVTWYVLQNGIIDSCTQNVIRNAPSAYNISFTTSPPIVAGVINICNGQSITFNDNSTGITGLLWNFGNGYYSSNSTHTEPAWHYPPGTYYDTLTVYDDCGTPHDTAFMVVVDSASGPDIFCISVVCPGDTVTYHTNANCTTYNWSVTGGTFLTVPASTSDSATVIWGAGPQGTISLSVSGCTPPLNCPFATIKTVSIVPATLPIAGDTVVCSGSESCYAVECIPGNNHSWELMPANAGVITGENTCEVCIEWDSTFFGKATLVVNYTNVLTGVGCNLPGDCFNDQGCGGSGTLSILVKPIFGIDGPAKVCPNVISAPFNGMNLTNNTIEPTTTWKLITPVPSTLTFGSTALFNAYTWNAGAGVYQVTAYAPPGAYCNDSAIITVEVVDVKIPNNITGLDTVCPNTSSFYSVIPNMTGVTYTWTVVGGTIIGPNNGSSVNIQWNPGGGTVSVIQTLTAPPGCVSASSAVFTVKTWPNFSLPVITSSAATVCVKSTVTYSIPPTLLSNATYTWSIVPATAGNIITANGTNTITIYWLNASPPPVVKLKISRCYEDSVMFPVNLLALPPVPNISYSPLNPCKNTVVNFSTTSLGPTYNWNFGDAGTSTLQNPTHIYTSAGSFNVQLVVTNTNGCSDTATTPINIEDVPVVPIITGPSSVCLNNPTSYTFSQPLFMGANYTWSLSAPALGGITSSSNNTLNVLWSIPGTDTVKLHVQSTCLDTILKYVVTVYPLPSAGIIVPSPLCEGAPLTFNGTGGVSYSWSFPGASSVNLTNNAAPVVIYNVAGNYTASVSVTDANGCNANTTVTFTVNPLPVALISGPGGVCTFPATINMSAVNIGGYSYLWTPGGYTTPSISHTISSATTFSVVVTNSFGCTRNSNTITVVGGICDTIQGPCIINDSIDFTYTPPICLTQTYTKTLSAPIGGWNFGPGGSAGAVNTASATYPYPGIYFVNVYSALLNGVDTSGAPCTGQVGKTRMVTIPFDARFETSFQCNGSNQMQAIFTNTSLYLNSAGLYNWTWYDVTTSTTLSTNPFPPAQLLSAGPHTISLYIFDPVTLATCTISHNIVVPVPITANFTVSSPVCQGSPATFTDTSTPLANEITRLFNNGNAATSTASPANLVYINSGPFNATLTVTDIYGCNSTASQFVTVNPAATGTITVTAGCDSVQLFSSGAGPFTWNIITPPPFPTNPVYVKTSGFYSVTSVDGNGCPFTVGPVQVTVQKSPNATITGQTQYCQGENLDIKTSAAGTNFAWVLLPSTPVGGNTPNLTVIAGQGNAGTFTYQVTVTGLNGCTAQATYTITVDPVPASASIVGGPLTFCNGDSILLTVNPPGATYLWSKSPTPALTSPANTNDSLYVSVSGTYSVIVQTAIGCAYPAIAPVTVTVNPKPVANISGDTVLCEGETLVLSTPPVGGATYAWSGPYGTGNTNTYVATNMQLGDAGIYTVVVTNSFGCSRADSVTVIVNPTPAAPVIGPPGPFCEGVLHTFCVQAPTYPVLAYTWSTGQNGYCINAALAGDYSVYVTNTFGCSATSNTITINPLPDLSCVATGCYEFCDECDSVTIPGPFNLASYDWQQFIAGVFVTYSNAQNLVVLPPGGTFRLVGYNQFGCMDSTDTLSIDFRDCCPPVDTSCATLCHVDAGNDTTVCAGSVVTLQVEGCDSIAQWYELGPNYQFNFIGNGPIIDVTPAQSTCYAVICCCPETSCCDTDTVCINVNPLPVVTWPIVYPDVCLNSTPVYLDTLAINAIPAGGSGVFSGPFVTGNYFYPNALGSYPITYCYTDTNGCTKCITNTINVIPCCDTSCHVDLGPDQSICIGQVAILSAQGCSGNTTWYALNNNEGPIVIGQGLILDVIPQQTTCYMAICCCIDPVNPTILCCDTDTICIIVRPLPKLMWQANYPNVCLNSDSVYLDTANIFVYINNNWIPVSMAGGTGVFVGTGVVGNYFYPTTLGTHTITYNYTDSSGCTGSVSIPITVIFCCDTSCQVNAGPDQHICIGNPAILNATGCDSVYTWYQLTANGPVPVGAGPIVDVFPQQNTCYMVICCCSGVVACCDTDTVCIVVNPLPTVVWNANFPTVCLNSSPVYLDTLSITALPPGGTGVFSGPNVIGYYFYPNTLGPQTITYCYTDTNGCTTCITNTINVIPCCDTSCHVDLGPDQSICAGQVAILSAQGCSGNTTWYALNNNEGPVVIGQGPILDVIPQQTTCYMAICCCIDPVNPTILCCDTDTVCIIVNPLPTVIWHAAYPSVCLNSAPVYLDTLSIIAVPPGGTGVFSGPNVIGYYFYPNALGPQTITYCYTDTNGCTTCVSNTINVIFCCDTSCQVNAGNDTTICAGSSVMLNATGCTGAVTWYAITQEGPILIGQEPEIGVTPQQTTCYMAICCCTGVIQCCDTDYVCITVNPLPFLQWPLSYANICLNGPPIFLDPANIFVAINQTMVSLPFSGGTWMFSGTGVFGSSFFPNTLGTHTITLTYTDSNGCTGTVTNTITVINCCDENSCNDNNLCTIDECDPTTGNCLYSSISYDDGNACTIDGCDPLTGIYHLLLPVDDGNACTFDYCDPHTGEVSHTPFNVDDGNACTIDECDPHTGVVSHVPVNCDDNNRCTIDACDPASGMCYYASINPDDGDPCTIDGCDPLTGVYHIPVVLVAGPITGTYISACLPAVFGGSNYSIPAIPGASYIWSVPIGKMTIVSGQGTNAIIASWNNLAINNGIVGQICVTVITPCGTQIICIDIDLNSVRPVTPGSISGPAKVCPGDIVTYSVAPVPRASNYTWTLPAGMTIISGAGTNVITVAVGAGYTGGIISVTANNVCGVSSPRTKAVSLNNLPASIAISGPVSGVCAQTGVVYTATSVIGASSYIWTVPAGATITSGQGTATITVNFSNSFTSGAITVAAVNGCGTGAVRTLTVKGAPATPGPISGSTTVCTGGIYHYNVATVAGTTVYTWTAPGTIINGQGTKDIDVQYGAVPASGQVVTVTAGNSCGTSAARTLSGISINYCIRIGGSDYDVFSVYPNPAHHLLEIGYMATEEEEYTITMTDARGRVLINEKVNAGKGMNHRTLDVSNYDRGLYLISLTSGDHVQLQKVILE